MSLKIIPVVAGGKKLIQKNAKLALGLAAGLVLGGMATETISVVNINKQIDESKKYIRLMNFGEENIKTLEEKYINPSIAKDKNIHWYDLPSVKAARASREWRLALDALIAETQELLKNNMPTKPEIKNANQAPFINASFLKETSKKAKQIVKNAFRGARI